MDPSSAQSESVFASRKRKRRENYLAGCARKAYRLENTLHTGIRTRDVSSPSLQCNRGCPQVLSSLKSSFEASGLHPKKTLQKRVSSYPFPKKPDEHIGTSQVSYQSTQIFYKILVCVCVCVLCVCVCVCDRLHDIVLQHSTKSVD